MSDDAVNVSQRIDDAVLAEARRDVGRGLILQNARTANRWDLFSSHRTKKNEDRLRRFGIVLSTIGTALAGVLVVRGLLVLPQVPLLHVALFSVLLALTVTFQFAPALRARGMARLDATLKERGARLLGPLEKLMGEEVRYTFDGGVLRCERLTADEPVLRFERQLAAFGYALRGDAVFMLFSKKSKQNPRAFVLAEGDASLVQDVLEKHDITVERLASELLPPSTVPRQW